MKNRIGFDIGGVILQKPPIELMLALQRHTRSIEDIVPYALPIRYVTESIRGIAKKFGPENIFLISKANGAIAELTMRILTQRNFFKFTCVRTENVYFCPDVKSKINQCQKCDVTHFVDDNVLILSKLNLISPSTHLILFQNQRNDSVSNVSKKFGLAHYSIIGDGRYLYNAIIH